jgi:hypothetical protein
LAYFKDAEEVYETIGKLFVELIQGRADLIDA